MMKGTSARAGVPANIAVRAAHKLKVRKVLRRNINIEVIVSDRSPIQGGVSSRRCHHSSSPRRKACAKSFFGAAKTAGAADFFAANLCAQGHETAPVETKPHSGYTLFVCGSMSAWANQRAQQCEAHDVPVCAMPEELLGQSNNPAALHDWVSRACATLTEIRAVMLAIGRQKAIDYPAMLEELLNINL